MARYNHAYVIAFSVVSNDPKGHDVDAAGFRAAMLERVAELDREDTWIEATGAPYDTYEEPEDDR